MNIVLVDDERLALQNLERVVKEACLGCSIEKFLDADDALSYVRKNNADLAFLDIEMQGMDGLLLAKCLKECNPEINIVFVTGYPKYAADSYAIPASDYILKPPTPDMVRRALTILRTPASDEKSRIQVQTFGNFEIFVDGKPLHFGRKKSKEILAYLIDRKGSAVSVAELAGVLFEDKPYDRSAQKQMQVYISELLRSLREVNAQQIILRNRNNLSVDNAKLECDYYDFLKMKSAAVNAYRGEYLSNYAWAEFTIGTLSAPSF